MAHVLENDQKHKQKGQNIEKNLDLINTMYQNIMSEKTILKSDNQANEKRLKKKDEKIEKLEKAYTKVQKEAQNYLTVIKELKKQFLILQNERRHEKKRKDVEEKQNDGIQYKKTIRGGGAKGKMLEQDN